MIIFKKLVKIIHKKIFFAGNYLIVKLTKGELSMKQFGDRLRELREDRDLKQRDVAKDLFISNKVLSSYERNVAFPSIDMFKKICEYYNVSADYLLQIEVKKEDEPAEDTSRLVALTPSQARLLSYYERLSTENQDAVRGLMVLYYKEQLRKKNDIKRKNKEQKDHQEQKDSQEQKDHQEQKDSPGQKDNQEQKDHKDNKN